MTSVYVAVPNHRPLHPLVCDSLLRAQKMALKHGIDIEVDVTTAMVGISLPTDRSHCIDAYYKSGMDVLAFIDSDICFTPGDFLTALSFALKYGCVAGIYAARTDYDGRLILSNSFMGDENGQGYCEVQTNEDGLITWPELVAGLGFCFTRREIIGKMFDVTERTTLIFDKKGQRLEKPLRIKLVLDWEYIEGSGQRGEDHVFFDLVRKIGYTPWVWPEVPLGHITTYPIMTRLSDLMQLKAKDVA